MKIIQRGIMKVVPGKMSETMKLMEEWKAAMNRLGAPIGSMKVYRRLSGGDDVMQTIIFEGEWDSFTTMATFFDKAFTDKKYQAHMAKWNTLIESHQLEILTPIQ
jgi:hypothetical protein